MADKDMNEKYPSVRLTRLVMTDKDIMSVMFTRLVMADKDMNEKVPVGYVYEISHG